MRYFAEEIRHTTRAGVAVAFAVTVLPVLGLIGLAVDIGFVTQARNQLGSAADSAALAAAKTAADAFAAGQPNYIALGQAAGQQWFASQANSVMGANCVYTYPPVAATKPGQCTPASITVAQSGAVFTSTVVFTNSTTPFFAPLFGLLSPFQLGGTASATITTTAFVSVTFLLDNSSSMLIAATQAGVNWMDANIPGPLAAKMSVPSGLSSLKCAFACHWDAGNNDYYGLARRNNILLRFDVLQSAVASAINQMINQQVIPGQFSVSISTFGAGPTAGGLTQIYPADQNQATSTDLTDGIAAAQNMRTPVVIDAANTDFPSAMAALAAQSTAAGDGSSVISRKKALIIVSDGLADYGPRISPTSRGPINPANCSAMKALGYSIYFLYTTYITTPLDVIVNNTDLLPYINGTSSPTMAGSLQSCASAPTNYAEASDPAAISTAMNQMLQAALGNGGRFSK